MVKEIEYGNFGITYTQDDLSRYNLLRSLLDTSNEIISLYQQAEIDLIQAKNNAICNVSDHTKLDTMAFGSSAFKNEIIYTIEVSDHK